jgi:transposase
MKEGVEMPKRHYINEDQVKELKNARKKNKDKNVEKRLKTLLLHAEGKTREETALQTGFAKTYITKLVSKYCNQGLSAIVDNHYPGNRRNLSFEEEQALLDKFKEQAEQGQMVEISKIKKAYEEAIGRSIDSSHGQIYRILARHDWRKVMPRSKHPNKASDEEIESSKKLTIR